MRALLIALAACGSTPSHPIANHGSGQPASSLEVSLERTPCMGQCPTYKLTIARDGAVSLTGTPPEGKTPVARVTPENLTAIAAKLDAVNFFAYGPDGYIPRDPVCKDAPGGGQTCEMAGGVGCSDTTEAIITVTRDGKTHKTTDAHCEPSPLVELEDLIDRAAGL
jgi:hypothetical protein